MEELSVAPEVATALLRRGLEDLEERIRKHRSDPPALSIDIAGRALYEQSRRLAASYARLHAAEMRRMQSLSRMLSAALDDVGRVDVADRVNASDWGLLR